ncbi:MAG: hypothetical protein KDE01_02400, partial [Caldilineaceae bacterium]|nr:hypothetical protein [Caldilineaceae bacterium]
MANLEAAGRGRASSDPAAARDELGGRSPSRPWPLERWLPPALLLAGLALWEVAARAGWISALFFPPPSAITLTLLRMVGGADFWAGLGSTLMR